MITPECQGCLVLKAEVKGLKDDLDRQSKDLDRQRHDIEDLKTLVGSIILQRDDVSGKLAKLYPLYRRRLIERVLAKLEALSPIKTKFDEATFRTLLTGKEVGNKVVHTSLAIGKSEEYEAITSSKMSPITRTFLL
jgi:hypothetical protein